MIRHLRAKAGAWLLRPYLAEQVRHYTLAEQRQLAAHHIDEAVNCSYIILGLKYAANPTRRPRR